MPTAPPAPARKSAPSSAETIPLAPCAAAAASGEAAPTPLAPMDSVWSEFMLTQKSLLLVRKLGFGETVGVGKAAVEIAHQLSGGNLSLRRAATELRMTMTTLTPVVYDHRLRTRLAGHSQIVRHPDGPPSPHHGRRRCRPGQVLWRPRGAAAPVHRRHVGLFFVLKVLGIAISSVRQLKKYSFGRSAASIFRSGLLVFVAYLIDLFLWGGLMNTHVARGYRAVRARSTTGAPSLASSPSRGL